MKRPLVCSTTLLAHRRLWIVLAALAALAAYYRMFWAFWLLAVLLAYQIWSWIWTLLSSRHLWAGDPVVQASLFAGDTLRLTWRFANRGRFSLARCGLRLFLPAAFGYDHPDGLYVVREESAQKEEPRDILCPAWLSATMHCPWLKPGEERAVTLELSAPLRGCYYLPAAQAFAGDPSGLYRGINPTTKGHFVTVFPALWDGQDPCRAPTFDETLREDLFGLEDPYQAVGVREYETGDSPKSINWYATARTSSVKTNLYRRQLSAFCLVALDVSCGFDPPFALEQERREEPRLEQAISAACSTALSQLSRGVKTAFVTNAPTLHWEQPARPAPPGDLGIRLKRNRGLTALDFVVGAAQERQILELCAGIDDTARATLTGQKQLWETISQVPAQTAVYLFCYHTPPGHWQRLIDLNGSEALVDPAGFYTPARLAGLPSSSVRIADLSKRQPSGDAAAQQETIS